MRNGRYHANRMRIRTLGNFDQCLGSTYFDFRIRIRKCRGRQSPGNDSSAPNGSPNNSDLSSSVTLGVTLGPHVYVDLQDCGRTVVYIGLELKHRHESRSILWRFEYLELLLSRLLHRLSMSLPLVKSQCKLSFDCVKESTIGKPLQHGELIVRRILYSNVQDLEFHHA